MSVSSGTSDRKHVLRQQMRRTLAAIPVQQHAEMSRAACERIVHMDRCRLAGSVMAYLPLAGEVDCSAYIEHTLGRGIQVSVPHVDWERRQMRPVRLESLECGSLHVDRHGVRHPMELKNVEVSDIAIVIMPGLAFDEHGGRLGRGGGFYDRFMAALPDSTLRIGLAFEQQIVNEVPMNPHDGRVRLIVTDSRIIECG